MPVTPGVGKTEFLEVCVDYLKAGLLDKSWAYWVADRDGELISLIFLKRIRRVPKPNRMHDEYGYITNVYTKPLYRGQGIGSELMRHVLAWAEAEDIENLIVWPSDTSIAFYARSGFVNENDVMEYQVRSAIA